MSNAGGVIKGFAIVCGIVGVLLSICLGIYISTKILITGLELIFFGILGSMLIAFITYGFGQIVEDINKISRKESIRNKLFSAKVNQKLTKELDRMVEDDIIDVREEQISTDPDVSLERGGKANFARSGECPCCFGPIDPNDKE